MKRLFFGFCTAIAMALLSVGQAAQTVKIGTVIFSAPPADGDSITVNGSVRTFKTVVTSAPTQVAIGATTNITAANYVSQLGSYAYTDLSASLNGGSVYLVTKADGALAISMSGAWGTVAVTNYTLTNYTAILPFSAYPPANRATMGNLLVDAISTYPTAAISATAPSMANFLPLNQASTVTGANTYSNIAQMFVSGILTNMRSTNMVFEHAIKMMVTQGFYLNGANFAATNETPLMDFYDNVGAANQKRTRVIADLNGWNVYFYNDALAAYSNVFTIARDSTYGSPGATFRTALIAPTIQAVVTNTTTTNLVMMHALASMVQNAMVYGTLWASNTAPTMELWDTDAASGSKRFAWKADANVMRMAFEDDSGAVPISPSGNIFTVSRTHGTDATLETMNIYPAVTFNGGVQFLSGDLVSGALARIGGGVIIGTGYGTTLPAGASQTLVLATGAGPSGTLSGATAFWSSGGEGFYRNGASGEGDTVDNRLHNREDEVFGAGTDYNLTSSTAFVDFGTTDPKVTLPTPGTYWIEADVGITSGTTVNDSFSAKLRNETTSTDITGGSDTINFLGNTESGTIHLHGKAVATSSSNVIAIWAFNNSGAARGKAESARTRIRAIRLY